MVGRNQDYSSRSGRTTKGDENQPYDGVETLDIDLPKDVSVEEEYSHEYSEEDFAEASSNAKALRTFVRKQSVEKLLEESDEGFEDKNYDIGYE